MNINEELVLLMDTRRAENMPKFRSFLFLWMGDVYAPASPLSVVKG